LSDLDKTAVYHNYLGTALEKQGDLEGAIAEYRTALLYNSNLLSAHYDLGKALQAKGDFVSARKEFEEALQMLPQTPQYEEIRTTSQSNLSDLDKTAVYHNYLGTALEKQGDLEGAIAEYRIALIYNSNLLSAHYDLGKALQAKGDFVLARKEFEEASQMIPQASEDQARIKTIQSILRDLDKLQP
jgi:tetratricopeptide (TPR) repeat protein